ncbi:MAG: hypothetical protein MJZ62_03075 [Bacteroidales bacterium]|nr:hypothetical protein [Bacteroidales bacterium]
MKQASPIELISRILVTLLVIISLLYLLLGASWKGVWMGAVIIVGVYLLTINIIKDIRRKRDHD